MECQRVPSERGFMTQRCQGVSEGARGICVKVSVSQGVKDGWLLGGKLMSRA